MPSGTIATTLPAAGAAVYRVRRPAGTLLPKVMRENLETNWPVAIRRAISMPKRVRWHLREKPEVVSGLLGVFLRAVETTIRIRSPNAPAGARFGAVAFVHRFGSYLNSHGHLDTCLVDAVDEATARSLANVPANWAHHEMAATATMPGSLTVLWMEGDAVFLLGVDRGGNRV